MEAHVQAKTDAVFDAAAALLDAGPERARPSLWRAEKDKASSTTSKSPISIKAAAIVDCSCPRAAACIAPACAAAARSSRRTAPSPASSAAGHRPSGEAVSHHLARTCHQSLVFDIISPARFFLPPQQRSTELEHTGLFTFRKRVSLQPPTCSAGVPTAGAGRWDIGLDDLGQRSAGPIL